MKFYYNKKCEDTPILREGDQVYLLRQIMGQKNFNIQSKYPSNKLDTVKYRLFQITKKLANNNYYLKLSKKIQVYLIFHILLLELTKNPKNNQDKADNEEYKVEKIIDQKTEKGQIYYLIKQKGYLPEENTWEPVRYLSCPEKIEEYNQ